MYKNESIVRERKSPPCSVWTSFKCLQHKLCRPTIFCHFVTLHRVEKWCFRPTFSSISCFFFYFFPEEETRKRDEGRRGDAVFWKCVLRTCFKWAVVTVCAMCLTDSKKRERTKLEETSRRRRCLLQTRRVTVILRSFRCHGTFASVTPKRPPISFLFS